MAPDLKWCLLCRQLVGDCRCGVRDAVLITNLVPISS